VKPKEIFEKLKTLNIRIFALRLGGHRRETMLYIHPDKSTAQWRKDLGDFRDHSERETSDWADDRVWNDLTSYLTGLGYCQVEDVAADVFEGRIAATVAKLVDDPDHEEQEDGFGHFGWESKPCKMKESPSGSEQARTI
jgi:hypothetical protein